jgi:hypothetical protein
MVLLIWAAAVGFCILRVFGPKVLLVVLVTPVALGGGVLGFKDDLKAMVWPAEAPRTLVYDDDPGEPSAANRCYFKPGDQWAVVVTSDAECFKQGGHRENR